jgi:hypothetical protein
MKYTEWELLNEAIGGAVTLGLSNPQAIGGPVGANFQEGPINLDDDDEDDEDDDKEGEEDEDETDLLGKKPQGPSKGFPPDDSESMDGLPTPDEEMLDGEEGGDEMDKVLGDIDPDLAGLGDDMGPMDGGGEELPPEIADMMGDEMGPEMGDEMGPEMGDEMGPEMGPEMDTAADLPCPDCNPEGEMEEGEPECETCGGEGFVTDDQMEVPEDPGMVDADMEMGDEMGMGDEVGVEGPAGEMMDLMSRMNAYCAKYMPAMMQAQMSSQMQPQMASYSKKHMSKIAPNDNQAAKYRGASQSGEVRRPPNQIKVKARSFMDKDGCAKGCQKSCCKEGADFLAGLADAARGTAHQKWSSGLQEDALLPPAEPQQPQQPVEPQPGDVGFAPQAKVGGIGGGYEMSDFDEIPTLGESRNYSSWKEFLTKKDK